MSQPVISAVDCPLKFFKSGWLSIAVLLIVVLQTVGEVNAQTSQLPNVLVIYADDLGFGDLSCYNEESKVQTPNLDRLAGQGLKFTDAHSAATVCTPSRYSLLTGRYAFRLPNHGRVFAGIYGPNLIEKERLSLGGMFQDAGYGTACVGKWHLGMTFYDSDGQAINQGGKESVERIDYSRKITGSPIERGFDYFFGTVACPTTDWFYAFVEGDSVPNPPTQLLDKTNLPKHPYSRDNRRGWVADDFDLERVDLTFLEKSQSFLRNHVKNTPDKPFFLFHSMQAVHLPSFPAKEYQGKTNAGPHGDFLFEMDDIVGKLLETLDDLEVSDNTIVIFTSDNGPEVLSVYHMRTDHQHDGARPWRGVKRDNWEGGHRVPMIVRWPGKVAPATVTDQLICQTDLMATLATVIGTELDRDCAEDSFDLSSVLLGTATEPVRKSIIHQGFAGIRKLAYRSGKWKYLNHAGSGGNNYENSKMLQGYRLEGDLGLPEQLYDLDQDPGETKNLAVDMAKLKSRLASELETIKKNGRSVER